MFEQALAGVRVLDLTQGIAGPYCTRILAGFGADVIKIEKPGAGDMARRMGPFLEDVPGPERSGLFLYLNSSKKSITLNLKSRAGVRIFKELAKNADIVVESFRPGVMGRLALSYRTLQKVNPRLVMTSISNFGQTGQYRDYRSAHIIFWSMAGGRYSDGAPGVKPFQGGGWLTHYVAGVHAVVGTMAALYQRNEAHEGQQVDVSILEAAMLSCVYPATVYSYLGVVHNDLCKYYLGILPCKDGYIGLNIYTLAHWERLCAFFGMPELSQDPRFQTLLDLKKRVEEARAIFAPHVLERDKMELFQSGAEWQVPFSLVPTIPEILDSPQHRSREFFQEVEHPVMGRVTMPGAPFKLSETPWREMSAAPLLGEHNEEIYRGRMGYSQEELAKLREMGAI